MRLELALIYLYLITSIRCQNENEATLVGFIPVYVLGQSPTGTPLLNKENSILFSPTTPFGLARMDGMMPSYTSFKIKPKKRRRKHGRQRMGRHHARHSALAVTRPVQDFTYYYNALPGVPFGVTTEKGSLTEISPRGTTVYGAPYSQSESLFKSSPNLRASIVSEPSVEQEYPIPSPYTPPQPPPALPLTPPPQYSMNSVPYVDSSYGIPPVPYNTLPSSFRPNDPSEPVKFNNYVSTSKDESFKPFSDKLQEYSYHMHKANKAMVFRNSGTGRTAYFEYEKWKPNFAENVFMYAKTKE